MALGLGGASITQATVGHAVRIGTYSGMNCVPDGTSGYTKSDVGVGHYGPFNNSTSVTKALECPVNEFVPLHYATRVDGFEAYIYDRSPNEILPVVFCQYSIAGTYKFPSSGSCATQSEPAGFVGSKNYSVPLSGWPIIAGGDFFTIYVVLPKKYDGNVSHITTYGVEAT
jgi:hypothetical protein